MSLRCGESRLKDQKLKHFYEKIEAIYICHENNKLR